MPKKLIRIGRKVLPLTQEQATQYFAKKRAERKTQSSQVYTSEKWRKKSKSFLKSNPFCKQCDINGVVREATDTDHIIPHKLTQLLAEEKKYFLSDKERKSLTLKIKEAQKLFWDKSNFQALCKSCHGSKSMRELSTL